MKVARLEMNKRPKTQVIRKNGWSKRKKVAIPKLNNKTDMMGKAGTLWRESSRTSFKKAEQSKEREAKMRSGKIRLIAYHCLRIKVSLKRRT